MVKRSQSTQCDYRLVGMSLLQGTGEYQNPTIEPLGRRWSHESQLFLLDNVSSLDVFCIIHLYITTFIQVYDRKG